MRLGLALPVVERDGSPPGAGTYVEGARRIEAAGFDSAWVFDALGRGFLLPDPFVALAAAAVATSRIELGTGVLQLPLRAPIELAQRVATTQLVAGGRLVLGVGAGSTEADFAAMGAAYEQRFTTFGRHLRALRALLAGDEVDGRRLPPWPAVQGGPPILVGSWAGSRWIPTAARELDGWIGSGARSSWALAEQGISRFRAEGGRRAVLTNVATAMTDEPSPDGPDDPVELRGSAETIAARLHRLAGLGFDDVVMVVRDHRPEALTALRVTWPRD
ncbi:MAG: LLM class flavin-dependent oxidoreductase [Acidimicrobiia bacterium]|nr:LLM class flavin-dependent oxidoreductase [Acidimicrobiia bacterium]